MERKVREEERELGRKWNGKEMENEGGGGKKDKTLSVGEGGMLKCGKERLVCITHWPLSHTHWLLSCFLSLISPPPLGFLAPVLLKPRALSLPCSPALAQLPLA